MNRVSNFCGLMAITLSGLGAAEPVDEPSDILFQGMANASAAVALDTNHFLVADDEDNRLRVYDITGGNPQRVFDWTPVLLPRGKHPDADLEAAARVGDRVYWLSSHSRDNNGVWRPNRHRFFATDLTNSARGISLTPVGKPCNVLLSQLLRTTQARNLGLLAASAYRPDDGGINFEGLASRAEGGLWLGLRSPLFNDNAILLPLLNPDDVLLTGTAPQFGEALLLDLDGRGVRDLAFAGKTLYIIAGGTGPGRTSRLYSWKADSKKPKRLDISLEGFNAEAIAIFGKGEARRLFLLADEGGASTANRTFRGRWFQP